jgi:uncharacterized membrane protein
VNSDLIVMTFDDGKMAETVYGSLRVMRKNQVMGLDESVILTRDGHGQAQVLPGSPGGAGLADLLAQLVFASTERAVLVRAGVNLDEQFVASVVSALRDCGSALLFFVQSESLSDTGELINALALFRGIIHQTTLSSQDEAVLVRIQQSARVFT